MVYQLVADQLVAHKACGKTFYFYGFFNLFLTFIDQALRV